MEYTTKKPSVGDLRAIYALKADEQETPFLLAERCILVDGKPIGRDGLDALDVSEFEALMTQINAPKKP